MTGFSYWILTPQGLAASGEAGFLLADTTMGKIGLLARHTPLLASLRAGMLQIQDLAGNTQVASCGHGVILVTPQRVIITTHRFAEQSGASGIPDQI